MLIQMLSPSVIALMLVIGVAPEKALPALVAKAGKNNAKAKEEKKIKVEFSFDGNFFIKKPLMFSFTILSSGQKLLNSPYSRFNLGSIEPTGSFKSLSFSLRYILKIVSY